MITVLISAFACNPEFGSEFGVGWNWVSHISKYCKVHVITESSQKKIIDNYTNELQQKANLTFHYIPVKDSVWDMYHNQGDWRFYYFYYKWQKHAYKLAKQIINETKIDIVHQLGLICFREPGFLWKFTDIPFVWGPLGGFNFYPKEYLKMTRIKTRIKNRIKQLITQFQFQYSNRVKYAIKKSNYIMVSSINGRDMIYRKYKILAQIESETGCFETDSYLNKYESKRKDDYFHILWVGRFIESKLLDMALSIIAKIDNKNIKFHIVGEGRSESVTKKYKDIANKLGINDYCVWHGKIPNDQVHTLMQNCDLFLFTSVVEATSTVVVEALSNKLPIICFNTCGFANLVNETVGYKINLSNYKDSIIKFVNIINNIIENKDQLIIKSNNCHRRIEYFLWDNKAKRMVDIYKNLQ